MSYGRVRYKPKAKPKTCELKPLESPDCDPVVGPDPVQYFYCAGEVIPLESVGLVTVFDPNGNPVPLTHGSTIPEDTPGFVIMDPKTKRLKYVSGPAPVPDEVVVPDLLQEMFCPGDYLPSGIPGKVNVCLSDDSIVCLVAGDQVPEDAVGSVLWDEISGKLHFSRAAWKASEISSIAKDIAAECIANTPDQVRPDAEIIALSETVVNLAIANLPPDQVRTDAEIAAVAKPVIEACLAQLPEDQVRTDLEIIALATNVMQQYLQDFDADVKAIAQQCFEALSAQFLTSSEVYSYVDAQIAALPGGLSPEQVEAISLQIVTSYIAQLPPPEDNVRSDLEIQGLAKQVFMTCLDLLPPDQVRSDLEIEGLFNQFFIAAMALLPEDQVRTDEEIKEQAKCALDECMAELLELYRPMASIEALAKQVTENCLADFVADLPNVVDTVRPDSEIIALVEQYSKPVAQACIDQIVFNDTDTVRSDEEIIGLATTVAEALIAQIVHTVDTDTVRSDEDIIALSTAVAQGLIDQIVHTVDTVRSDEDINTLAKAVVESCIRTDEELIQFIADYVGTLPGGLTAEQAKAIAQGCVDNLDLGGFLTDAEVQTLINNYHAANPDIDTFGVPQSATVAGTDVFGKDYDVDDPIIVYPGPRIVCLDLQAKEGPQLVRATTDPLADLSCLAECQYAYNCNTDAWLQKIEGAYITPATPPQVAMFVGTLNAREFACKYEDAGNVYCHNYQRVYEHGDNCVKFCAGSATVINFPAITTSDGSGFTVKWDGINPVSYNSGDAPSNVYPAAYSGVVEFCFDPCVFPAMNPGQATGSFQYFNSDCGC